MEKLSEFRIDDVAYVLHKELDGSVVFWQVETALDPWNFEDQQTYNLEPVGIAKNPMRVFRRLKQEIQSWLSAKRPHYFTFTARTPKMSRIYERLINGCSLAEYKCLIDGEVFHFYRLN